MRLTCLDSLSWLTPEENSARPSDRKSGTDSFPQQPLAICPSSSFGEDAAVAPVSVAIDAAAKYAYVANYGSNNISVFGIGSKRNPEVCPGIALCSGAVSLFNGDGLVEGMVSPTDICRRN